MNKNVHLNTDGNLEDQNHALNLDWVALEHSSDLIHWIFLCQRVLKHHPSKTPYRDNPTKWKISQISQNYWYIIQNKLHFKLEQSLLYNRAFAWPNNIMNTLSILQLNELLAALVSWRYDNINTWNEKVIRAIPLISDFFIRYFQFIILFNEAKH